MSRYFLEVAYKGTNYSGFQVQQNANTIQAEVEKALHILLKQKIAITGSSRTDAGVHARQNFFHFDHDDTLLPRFQYNINALLPEDIAVRNIIPVAPGTHCRFDATSRVYRYYITRVKDPFLRDRAYYFPFKTDLDLLHESASILKEYNDFTSFSKRNTQAKTAICSIMESEWLVKNNLLIYHVRGDRFLRGMVRALVSTMLKVGRQKLSPVDLRKIIEAKDCSRASFAVPAHGLFLINVQFPGNITVTSH
jgi:tRNA pseudouridine38-40 synthase